MSTRKRDPAQDKRQDRLEIRHLPTGVPGLDEILGGGLPEYSFNIIAGAPGCGKTTLAHQLMFANASLTTPALYFTVLGEPAIKMLLEGYAILWPDGRPLGVGFDVFCKQGQRLFGLGQHLRGCLERLVDIIYFPLAGLEDDLTRLPGHRVRRFFLHRRGRQGRLHFFNGTPTAIVLNLDRDEQYVLNWIGLPTLRDGESAWFDLAA